MCDSERDESDDDEVVDDAVEKESAGRSGERVGSGSPFLGFATEARRPLGLTTAPSAFLACSRACRLRVSLESREAASERGSASTELARKGISLSVGDKF